MATRVFRGSRKAKNWDVGFISELAQAAGVGADTLAGVVAFPRTMMRVRGSVFVEIDGPAADGQLVLVTCGIIVQAGDISTEVRPFSDGDAPWVWWGATVLSGEDTTEGASSVGRNFRFDVDSKAMRKISPNETVSFVIENTTIGTAASINTAGAVRILMGV